MFNNRFKFDATAELAKSILEADTKAKMEELKGKQTKLDKNHNGKLDAQDFKMLRGEKKVNEAEADYQSSYRVGKVANFKPKVSDVGQGRKITGKMGKYGKQPDDDNMVEPPPEHTVGVVKTDPSAVVPGHSTMGAKLHLASLPKDAEGNTIHKGARRVNAADLVAKRKAMMAGQKNEEVESIEEGIEDTLHPAGAALLKHIKPQHHNLYKPHLTKDVFKGSYGDRTSVLKAAKDAGHLKMDLKKQNEDVEELDERTLTSGETSEKERIVHGMKKSLKGFKARYGDRAKEVMYAAATKQAKKD
jgi:hypothetical protein